MVVRVPRLPRPGETVLGGEFQQVAGGKGANQAVAAARAGGRVAMVGCVGADRLGAAAVEGMRAAGVDVSRVHRVAEAASGVALIVVDAAGQNSIAVAPGANGQLTPGLVGQAESLLAEAEVVLVQLEVPLDAVVETVTVASRHGARVVLDPAPARVLPDELWRRLEVITPNATEAAALTGRVVRGLADAEAAATTLIERGVRTVIITLGADGLLVTTRTTRETIAAHPVDAVDTTAAGDTFAGALAVSLAEGADLVDAARFANAAAAVAVTRMGAQPSAPTRSEITHMLTAR